MSAIHVFRPDKGGHMKRLVVGIVAAGVLMSVARTAMAQAKTVSSEVRTETAIVESIDPQTRAITLKKADDTVVTVVAGPEITRFAEIKVGDKVTAKYYETMVVRVKQPGESEVDSRARGTTGAGQELPGGTKARQRTIPATITKIDMETPSISFTGPSGWTYSSKVQDKEALAKVKVGDKVELIWTEAVLVSIER